MRCQSYVNSLDNLDTDECLNALTRNDTRICAEGFYLANDSQTLECAPLCDFWIPALEFSAAEDVIFVTSMFVAIVVSIILIVMALWLQRDSM